MLTDGSNVSHDSLLKLNLRRREREKKTKTKTNAFFSFSWPPFPPKNADEVYSDSRFDHVIVGGVEDVSPDDPHDALLHQRLVRGPGQARLGGEGFPAPETRVGRDGYGAAGAWGAGRKEKTKDLDLDHPGREEV